MAISLDKRQIMNNIQMLKGGVMSATGRVMKIRIIGSGCDSCERLEKNVKSAAERSKVEYEFLKVCDYETKMTPILFINNKMISAGKVPSVVELESKLKDLAQPRK